MLKDMNGSYYNEQTTLGDVDGDGFVTNADVLMIYRYIYNPELYPLDVNVGDVDRDGSVTNADVLMIYRYIYNSICTIFNPGLPYLGLFFSV